ncbi:MAG: hypothetical protein IJ301_00630 [Clostridia bacterium]|nr:hypothetical protein [Clostridia bacterium]
MSLNKEKNEPKDLENETTITANTPRKTTTKICINDDNQAFEGVMINEPLANKNKHKDAKNCDIPAKNDDNVEFFDATADFESVPARDIHAEIEQAKKRAIQEKEMLDRVKKMPDNSRKTFTSCVIACLVSVGILLTLTIVFFLALRWYGVGLGFAVLTIVATQVWIAFFKKTNKRLDAIDPIDTDEITLQAHLKEKYGDSLEDKKK